MTAPFRAPQGDEGTIAREARRILRRLCETDAVLAVAQDLDRAVVLRPGPDGEQTRTAVVDRTVAQAFAIKDWIICLKPGRIARYTITAAGKAALRRLLDEDRRRRQEALGFAEAATPFQAQHAVCGAAQVAEGGQTRKLRVNLAESPLVVLGRRKGPDGQPFLSRALVQAGERLREDFERAQMGPRVGQNWDRFLTGGDRGAFSTTAVWPRARARRAAVCRMRSMIWGRDCLMWCCGCAVSSKGWNRRKSGWGGRHGRARSCSRSGLSGFWRIMNSATASCPRCGAELRLMQPGVPKFGM